MILLQNDCLVVLYTLHKGKLFLIKLVKRLMQENYKDYEFCIEVALSNAKKRITLLDNSDKQCILEEYKEWINDGVNKHTILLLREDPII